MSAPIRSASLVLSCLFLSSACQSDRNANGASDLAGMVGEPDFNVPFGEDLQQQSCATSTYEGTQAPAAMLAVLDRSASMSMDDKFTFASDALVQALDQDVFDTMYLGLYATPAGSEPGPQCLLGGLIDVDCVNAPFPQVDLALAGLMKSSDPTGVRHVIKSQINTLLPDAADPDSTPMYGAIQTAIGDLQTWPKTGKRILFIVTDGSFSCASLSNRQGLLDGNGCYDWEDPKGIITMLQKANQDPNTPVDTFLVGVPGADTYDATGQNAPPYHMRLALSAMAYAGSPANVPANCTGKTYSQGGADPTVSCHFDLTQNNFSATAIADAISLVRGKVLGCTYDLPQPDGGTVDPNKVNVEYGTAGNLMSIVRRANPSNTCLTTPCWDYDANGKVQLIGKACTDVQTLPKVNVQIVVGCETIIG